MFIFIAIGSGMIGLLIILFIIPGVGTAGIIGIDRITTTVGIDRITHGITGTKDHLITQATM